MTRFAGFAHGIILAFSFGVFLTASLTTPVIKRNFLYQVTIAEKVYNFGAFGYCEMTANVCTRGTGYDISTILAEATRFQALREGLGKLTPGLVMIPVTAVFCFFGMVIALFAERCGFLVSAILSLAAFLSAVCAIAVDLALFGSLGVALRDNTNASTREGKSTQWMMLIATILLLFCPLFGFYSCCAARRASRNKGVYVPVQGAQGQYGQNVPLSQYPAKMGQY